MTGTRCGQRVGSNDAAGDEDVDGSGKKRPYSMTLALRQPRFAGAKRGRPPRPLRLRPAHAPRPRAPHRRCAHPHSHSAEDRAVRRVDLAPAAQSTRARSRRARRRRPAAARWPRSARGRAAPGRARVGLAQAEAPKARKPRRPPSDCRPRRASKRQSARLGRASTRTRRRAAQCAATRAEAR